jgi:gliding motility-associated-like protein
MRVLSAQIDDIRNYVSTNALIYARFSAGPNCDAVSEVTLSVGELKIRPTKLYACSEIANEAVFNLIRSESYIMYGVEHSALWYQDAKLADNILTPGRYKSPTKMVWIDVTVENDSGCSTNSPIELEVLNLNPIDTLMTYCDDNVEGKSFNLRDLDAIMNQNTGLEVSWHKTANRINSINNPSLYIPTAYTDGVHTVYAEVCGNVAEVKLVVFEKDSFAINMTSDEYLIDQGETIDLVTSGKAFNHIWSPATGLSDTIGYTVSASPQQTTMYKVYIYNDAGCSTTDTVRVYVRETEEDLKEILAEIFTPDGNGTNDELFVQGPGVCAVDLKIFNRWGVLVFETTNPEIGWNGGKMNDLNDPVPADDYRYTLSVKHCGQGDEREVKEPGIITIIR